MPDDTRPDGETQEIRVISGGTNDMAWPFDGPDSAPAPSAGLSDRLYQIALRLDADAPTVLEAAQTLARLERQLQERRKDLAYHADCRPNRKQAEAAIADAKAMNDQWADEVGKRREAEETVARLEREQAEAQQREPPVVYPQRYIDKLVAEFETRFNALKSELTACQRERDEAREALRSLVAFQAQYAVNTRQPGYMPGNAVYSAKLMAIVDIAHEALYGSMVDVQAQHEQVEAALADAQRRGPA